MNCIIYKKGSNKIKYFIKDCIKKNNNFIGSNCKIHGVKDYIWDTKWTYDTINPINNKNDIQTGWDKTVDQIIKTNPKHEVKKTTDKEYEEALEFKQKIASLNLDQIEAYVNNNVVSFKEVQDYLKQLTEIVWGISKMMDME